MQTVLNHMGWLESDDEDFAGEEGKEKEDLDDDDEWMDALD